MTDPQQSPGVAVALCGMPSSGNRLLKGLMEHHRLVADIKHCGEFEELASGWMRDGLTVAAVMPVRDPDINRANCARYLASDQTYEGESLRHYTETVRVCAELRIPLLPVSYSQIVRNPGGLGRYIMTWLGQPFAGWPYPVVDGDAKYHAQLSLAEQEAERAAKAAAHKPDKSKEILAPISATLHGMSRVKLR